MNAVTWPYALLVGTAAAASMIAYWITIRAVLPWIGLRQAAAVSLGSNAVASTLPAGGAVAVGVSWAMLSSWGLSTAAARGWRITAATLASHLMLWLVLLACLRAAGLSQARLPWQTSLAAFAFIRLLTALPITPGGLGITELGLIGILAGGAGHKASVQVTAAVLMYRAVTYLPAIPLGVLACLTWRCAPTLISAGPRTLPWGPRPRCAGMTRRQGIG